MRGRVVFKRFEAPPETPILIMTSYSLKSDFDLRLNHYLNGVSSSLLPSTLL